MCLDCFRRLPWLERVCPCCGLPEGTEHRCGRCLKEPPPFTQLLAPWRYEAPFIGWIHQLKFKEDIRLGHGLGKLLAGVLQSRIQTLPEALFPVPLHWRRQMTRGCNQAYLLAKPIAKTFNLPIIFPARRIKHTPAQRGLKKEDRLRNMKNVFALREGEWPLHIALIDDVVTTGSTVSALAHLLLQAGVKRVDVWAITRVISNS